MRNTRLVAVLVGMIAMGIFAADASAMYHPGMGRFMQRDPGAGNQHRIGAGGAPAATGRFIPRDPTGSNQYADGMNLYQYVGSRPVVHVDPYGLWKILREGKAKAYAFSEEGDTFRSLAKEIGLDVTERNEWATTTSQDMQTVIYRGDEMYLGFGTGPANAIKPDQVLDRWPTGVKKCQSSVVRVPNTVLAVWAGEFGNFGKWWVDWEEDIADLRSKGFRVDEKSGITAAQFENHLAAGTQSKTLHGLFFWGHGTYGGAFPWWDPYGVITNPKTGWTGLALGGGQRTRYRNWKLKYKLGLGVLWACGTDPTARRFFAQDARFRGFRGVGIPTGFQDDMEDILDPNPWWDPLDLFH